MFSTDAALRLCKQSDLLLNYSLSTYRVVQKKLHKV